MHNLLTIHPSTHLVADGDTITLVHVTPTATGGLHLERFPLGTAPTSDDVLRLFDHLALTDNADIRALEWRVRSLEASDQYHRQQYEQAMTELARLKRPAPPSPVIDVSLSNGTRLTLTPPAEHTALDNGTCSCGFVAKNIGGLRRHISRLNTQRTEHASSSESPPDPDITLLPPVEPTPLPVRANDPAFAPLSPAKTRAERTRAQHHLEAA